MREILFKAKRKDNCEWVEGYYLPGMKFPAYDGVNDFIIEKNGDYYAICTDTLCQYTELTDKNGKKIWENDIVTITIECDDYFILSETGIVEYSYGQYELKVKTTDGKEAYSNLINKLSEAPFEIEKLGNIFDNADLLEVN